MSAGKLRNNIDFERKTFVDDGVGGGVDTWVLTRATKAMIKPLSGNESLQAQRLEAKTTHRVYCRYFADLIPADRIVFKGRFFQVRAIINIEERNRWYELHCEEGVAQ